MPRPLVVGNGNMQAALDGSLDIRDFYYPYVGMLNHLNGNRIRIGVWCEGEFAWLADPAWRKTLRYEPDTLVTDAHGEHPVLWLAVNISDAVSYGDNILLRRIEVENRAEHPREVRVFLAHDFHIAES